MAKLSQSEIGSLLQAAGFTGNDIAIGSAIALAESGGNPNVHNTTPPDDSYGLMQINMYGTMGPARRKQFGIANNSDLFDPATNCKAAYIVFKEQGWNGWSTYRSGAYKQHLPSDSNAFLTGLKAVVPGLSGITDGLSNLNPLSGIQSAIDAFGNNVFKAGTNIAGIMAAIAIFIAGVVFLLHKDVKAIGETGTKIVSKI